MKKVIFLVILIFLALEFFIRFYDCIKGVTVHTHNNLALVYIPNAYFNYTFRPNTKVAYNLKRPQRININSLGFRGKSFSVSKKDKYRIFCLGESSTIGYAESDDGHTWPAQLEKLLQKRFPERNIEVVNAGGWGYTTYELLPKYLFQISSYDPDLIIVYLTINDAGLIGYISREKDISKLRGHLHRNVLQRFFSNSAVYSILIGKLIRLPIFAKPNAANPENIDFGLNNFERNLDILVLAAKRDGVKIVLCTQILWLDKIANKFGATQEDRQAFKGALIKCEQIIRRVALRHDILLVDNANILGEDKNKYMADIVHLNDAGAKLLAGNIFQCIIKEEKELLNNSLISK